MSYLKNIQEAKDSIQAHFNKPIDLAIVLGSGLGPLADLIESPVILPYQDIPHFKTSTVAGHAGKLYIGQLGDKNILAMQGRLHYYEGYSMADITLPIRVFSALGIRKIILTNACGGISDNLNPGDIAYISDHLSFFCPSPLRGPNLDDFGERFCDMSDTYTPALIDKAVQAGKETGMTLKASVYAYFPGPQFETPAEIRALKALGASTVGMSTVPEAIVARHCGMDILGMSLITNKAAGLTAQHLSHNDVQETAAKASEKLIKLVHEIIVSL